MAGDSKARFRHEDISAVPRGWKVRTVLHKGSGHRIRIAFPPGRRQKGSGEVVSILHPLHGQNPCGDTCTLKSSNPAELMVMGANPPRRRRNPGGYRVVALARAAIQQPNFTSPVYRTREEAQRIAKTIDRKKFFRPHIQRAALSELHPSPENPKGAMFVWIVERKGPSGEWEEIGLYNRKIDADYEVTRRHLARASVGERRDTYRVRKAVSGYKENPTPELVVMGANPSHSATANPFVKFSLSRLRKMSAYFPGGLEKQIRAAEAGKEVWGERQPDGSYYFIYERPNPTVAANPGGAELYEQFQGREPKWETLDVEPHMPKGDYAKLGQLVALSVKPYRGRHFGGERSTEGGWQVQVIQWYQGTYDIEGDHLLPLIDAPWVVADESGRQIYFFKGNQDISDAPHPWLSFAEADPGDGIYELGEARVIRYRTHKAHDKEKLLDYVHRFGEESGIRPKVLFDSRAKRLLLEGGNYRVEAPGIID